MDSLTLKPLVIVRRHGDGMYSACLAFAPHIMAYADDRELALEELCDFGSQYFAELPADSLPKFVVPEEATLEHVNVTLRRADLPRADRVRTQVELPIVVLAGPTRAKWVMMPTLAQVVYVSDERAAELEQVVRDEVLRLVAAGDLDGATFLDLLPPPEFELTRPVIEVELRRDGDGNSKTKKARALRAAGKLLESVGRKLEPSRDALIGRDPNALFALLASDEPLSVVLVGREGAGKSSWLRAAAALGARSLYATSGAELVAGQSGLGQLEARIEAVVRAVELLDAVLYFENLEDLFAGKSGGHEDIAGLLRRHVQSGALRLVAEITPEGYDRLSQRHVGFFSYLQRFGVEPLSREQTLEVLAERSRLCLLRGARGMDAAARAQLLGLVERYEPYRVLPGKAARLFDELTSVSVSAEVSDAASARELSADQVLSGFASKSGIPAFLLRDERSLELASVERFFADYVVGQPLAVRRVAETLCSVKAGLQPSGKPLATLLFLGPTGVGKTELGKALARFLFGSAERMARFDMSEYTDAYAAERLIRGSERSDGVLTSRVREQPFGVVLLDEIEKAHSSVFDLLLQVAGEGRLSDGRGRVAHFDNTIIILTSNLGAQQRRPSVGFGTSADASDERYYLDQVERHFRPELVGRLDGIVTFSSLSAEQIRRVAELSLLRIARRAGIEGRESRLLASEAALDHLAKEGFSPQYGARALRRFLEQALVAPLSSLVSELGEQASAAVYVVLARHEAEPPESLLHELKGSSPAEHPPIEKGGISIRAFLIGRKERALSHAGVGAISRMRRAMRRWQRMRELVTARERLAEINVELAQARKNRTPSSTLSVLSREHGKLALLLTPLDDALREVEDIESLLVAALDEAAPDLSSEATAAYERFRATLLTALFQLSSEDALTFAISELDEQHALHRFLLPLLRYALNQGWETWLHFDRGARRPEDAWPPLSERRWGPPIQAATYLRELPEERPNETVLVRLRGAGAGALLSFYLGRWRYRIADKIGELWVRPLVTRYDLKEEDWKHHRLSPVFDREVGRRQAVTYSSEAKTEIVPPEAVFEQATEFLFEPALEKAIAGRGFLPQKE